MKIRDRWLLAGEGAQVLRLTRLVGTGRRDTVSPVLTVREVCRRLHKSRRQVYRYLTIGRLTPCARILGQWLFPASAVAQFGQHRVPGVLKPLFWDVRLSHLDTVRHRDFILGRVLEYGDRDAVRWALHMYPKIQVAAFLKGRGGDVLSRRTWHFWVAQMGLNTHMRAGRAWRRGGRQWGGFEAAA